MSPREAVAAYIADHPGAHSVDILRAHVVPGAEGTAWIVPHLLALQAEGTIRALPSPYLDHVRDYPGMHPAGAGGMALQATRWEYIG